MLASADPNAREFKSAREALTGPALHAKCASEGASTARGEALTSERGSPATLGSDDFDGSRLVRSGTWVVAFLADWCPFCRSFAPRILAAVGQGYEIAKADVSDAHSPLWGVFGIEVIPTVIVFRDGSVVFRADGRVGEGLNEHDVEEIVHAARG